MNNPPAFPDWTKDGMTLRDYFAAKAMRIYFCELEGTEVTTPESMAEWCYIIADAMLKAREQ